MEGEKPSGVGNPTEIALLLWLNGKGQNYMKLREEAKVINQLTFSTERKYMATLVDSSIQKKRILYIKGAPEIVMGKCNLDKAQIDKYNEQLLAYQNKAMRTLGIAYKVIPENASDDLCRTSRRRRYDFLGNLCNQRPDSPRRTDAVKNCQSAGNWSKDCNRR